MKESIRRNDGFFRQERLENMYQLTASCVFYYKNKDILMNGEDDDNDGDFDHAGDE